MQCKKERMHPDGSATIEFCLLDHGHANDHLWRSSPPQRHCPRCYNKPIIRMKDLCETCRTELDAQRERNRCVRI